MVYVYPCFITRLTKYCLIDDSGDIRDTSPDLKGIRGAKKQHGWGRVHKCVYDGTTLTIGRRV